MPDSSAEIDRPMTPPPVPLIGWRAELRLACAFLTRCPVRLRADEAATPLGAAVRAFPLVGILVGGAGAIVYFAADLLGLSALVAALLGVGAMVLATGALHEDGLADTADGLGAATRQRALDVMRDSRIGTFGVIALFFALSLRVTGVSYAGSAVDAVLLLLAAGAGSRAVVPAVMYVLPPARRDGLGWAAGQPDRRRVVDAGAIGALLVVAFLGPVWGLVAIAAATLATLAAARALARRLGGQTGDMLGAVQQLAEVAIILSYTAAPRWL